MDSLIKEKEVFLRVTDAGNVRVGYPLSKAERLLNRKNTSFVLDDERYYLNNGVITMVMKPKKVNTPKLVKETKSNTKK